MTTDEELLTSSLRTLGDVGLDDAELDRRVSRFQGALRRLRDDPAEAARIDALVTDAERGQPGNDLIAAVRRHPAARHGTEAGPETQPELEDPSSASKMSPGWITDWAARAACKGTDPDEFFVQGPAQNRAKLICHSCPVRIECLADALDNDIEFGVWGGRTARERRALLRRRPEVTSWRDLLERARDEYKRYRDEYDRQSIKDTVTVTVRDIIANAFADAGLDLGYTVSVCGAEAATGLELRREHEIVLLRVHDSGEVEFDHAGLSDAACTDRQLKLEQAVARQGVVLTQRIQHDHGTPQGGALIADALATGDPSLARATALTASRPTQRVPARGQTK